MQNQNESLIDILALLYKKRRMIITVCITTSVICAGISLLLPNFYEASTQFYAASPDLAQPDPVGNQSEQREIYGNDHDVDRLITIANSSEIKNFMIEEFDLYNTYDIDPDKPLAKHKVMLKLEKLYNIKKTKYDAIKLSFEDKDPERAAEVCNAVRNKVDSIASGLIKESQVKLIASYESKLQAKQAQYDEIADSLYVVRGRYNIFNTQSQGEAFGASMVQLEGSVQSYVARITMMKNNSAIPRDSIAIAEAKLAGFRSQYNKLIKNISSYNDGYPKVLKYERELKDFGDQLNLDKERMKQLKAAYNSKINAIHIVEKAEAPAYKSRPKRSYIVVGVAMVSFLFMSLWLILVDQFKKDNWGQKFRDA
jgi:tyrosine-protein kinase Etk/Wzc